MRKISSQGFSVIEALIIIIVIGALSVLVYRIVGSKKQTETTSKSATSVQDSENAQPAVAVDVTWQWNGQTWDPSSTPPACPSPVKFTVAPSDLSLATSVLYPGQTRGNYKPHGGIGFSGATNNIEVKAIMDGDVTSGSRYIEAGETQYLFWIENDCGIAYRFDHLLTLSPTMQAIADTLPEAKLDDSRTTNFDKPVRLKTGDTIATAVGFPKTKNVAYDLGVYDLRKPNASATPVYITAHQFEASQAAYALCWFDMFSDSDSARLLSLPSRDQKNGKTSDYCK